MSDHLPAGNLPPGLVFPKGVDLSAFQDGPFSGFIVSSVFLGIILVQAWQYLNSNTDKWTLRALVTVLVILNIAATVLNSLDIHYVQISNFGDITALQSNMPFLYQMSAVVITVVITLMVQVFFATRVLMFNRIHQVVPYIIIACAIAAFVPGIMVGVDGLIHANLHLLTTTKIKIQLGLYCGFAALGDLFVTFALLWSFRSSRTGIKSTDTLLQRLLQYTVTRGILMTLLQVILLVMYIAQSGSLNWTALYYCESKLYVITMLALLNSRTTFRNGSAVVTVSSGPVQSVQTSTHPSEHTMNPNEICADNIR